MLSISQIKFIKSLRMKKFRQEHGLFIAEGTKIAGELLQSDWQIDHLYAKSEWLSENEPVVLKAGVSFTGITDKELGRISKLTSPNQVLTVVQLPGIISDMPSPEKELILLLDNIQDPGNMGTIIRSADWFGIKSIICSDDCVDIYNPKVIQGTMGSFIRVNTYYTSLPDYLIAHHGTDVIGTIMDGPDIYDTDLPGQGILIIGNESHGIRQELLDHITQKVSIPSTGSRAESLNAAVATSIVLAEFYRQGKS